LERPRQGNVARRTSVDLSLERLIPGIIRLRQIAEHVNDAAVLARFPPEKIVGGAGEYRIAVAL
jgi:hypothetical protein